MYVSDASKSGEDAEEETRCLAITAVPKADYGEMTRLANCTYFHILGV